MASSYTPTIRALLHARKHRDRSRDRDIETLWCGEFGRLQALLHGQGTALVVERALGVGEVPLKEAIATATPSGQVQVSHARSGPA